MNAWLRSRNAAFEAMLKQWGVKFEHNGIEYDCMTNPITQEKEMRDAGYLPVRPTVLIMRSSDFDASNIGLRSLVKFQGIGLRVDAIINDPADFGVELRCNKSQ